MGDGEMIEQSKIYKLLSQIKGWPVQEAADLEEATQMILGSPYWDIPVDVYRVLDKNETYCLLAVHKDGRISMNNRYLALNMNLQERIVPASPEEDKSETTLG